MGNKNSSPSDDKKIFDNSLNKSREDPGQSKKEFINKIMSSSLPFPINFPKESDYPKLNRRDSDTKTSGGHIQTPYVSNPLDSQAKFRDQSSKTPLSDYFNQAKSQSAPPINTNSANPKPNLPEYNTFDHLNAKTNIYSNSPSTQNNIHTSPNSKQANEVTNKNSTLPLNQTKPNLVDSKSTIPAPSAQANTKMNVSSASLTPQTDKNSLDSKAKVPNYIPHDPLYARTNIYSTLPPDNTRIPASVPSSQIKTPLTQTKSNISVSVPSSQVNAKTNPPSSTQVKPQLIESKVNKPDSVPSTQANLKSNIPPTEFSAQVNKNFQNSNPSVSSSAPNVPARIPIPPPLIRTANVVIILPQPILIIPPKPLPDPLFFIPMKPSLPIPINLIPPKPVIVPVPNNPTPTANPTPVPQTPDPGLVKQKYDSKSDFCKIFKYLIEIEEAEEAKPFYENETGLVFTNRDEYLNLIEHLNSFDDTVGVSILMKLDNQLRISDNQRRVAIFPDHHLKINPNDLEFVVVQSTLGDIYEAEVQIMLDFCLFIFNNDVPLNVTSFNIGLQVKESFERIKEAMSLYLSFSVDPIINSIFLGHRSEARLNFNVEIKDYTAFGLFPLNNSQIKAVQNALKYKVSIIQGPPGTGKTQTISSIVYHIDNLCRPKVREQFYEDYEDYNAYYDDQNYRIHQLYNYNSPNIAEYFTKTSKILICAASNSPVFDLRRKLIEKGIKAVQVLARSKEDEFQNDPGTLKYQSKKKLNEDSNLNTLKNKLTELKKKIPNNPEEIHRIQKRINWLTWNIQDSIIKDHNIICCTTRVLQNSVFKETSFDFVIIDEATQCFETDIVLCLLKNVKHLILVGDIHQLGPVVKSQRARQLGFDVTTIERLQELGVPLTFLDTQFRMQPFLSAFSNINFYENRIKNGHINSSPIKFPNVVTTHGFFYHVKSLEEKRSKNSSFYNSVEAEAVMTIVRFLRSKNVENKNIGIITFYGGQREYLRGLIKKNRLENLEIMSVDESQGREKEYIVLSCVRSNAYKNVGFLEEYRRLNVAMTRVKNGLVVCGNANNFVKSELWSRLVSYFQVNNAIFTGELNCLRPFRVRLQENEPFSVGRRFLYSNL